MKKAALYARVSSDMQKKGGTIDSQIAELKKQISRAGDELVKEYIDEGHSGAYLDRPEMNRLRDDLKTNTFDAVYFLNTDRIARDVAYQNIVISEFIRYKKQLIINGKNYEHNPENKFTITVLGAVAAFERERMIERSSRGRKYWLQQGVLMSNGAGTYGYTYHRRTDTAFPLYTINHKEAAVIREIYERYTKGDMGYLQIANCLKNKNAYRRQSTGPWNPSHVANILKNEMYTGIRYFDTMTESREDDDPMHKSKTRKTTYRDRKEWIGIKIPAIVTKEAFAAVQRRIDHNKKWFRNAKRKYLLSGILWCGRCGSHCLSYRQYFQTKRAKGLRIYEKYLYVCNGKSKRITSCDTIQIDIRPLDACVLDMMRESMLNPLTLRACILGLKRDNETTKRRIEQQTKNLDRQMKDAASKKSRIVDLYASGDLDREEYLKRIAKYDTDITAFTAKYNELTKRTPIVHKPETIEKTITAYCQNVKARFETLTDFDSKRRFILDFIKKITYRNDRVTVHSRMPIGNSFLEFELKRKIDRVALRDQILEHDRKVGLRGTPIRREDFGHLAEERAKIMMPTLA